MYNVLGVVVVVCMGWGAPSSVSFVYMLLFFNSTPDLDYFRHLLDTFSIALFSNTEWSQWGESWGGGGGGGEIGEEEIY